MIVTINNFTIVESIYGRFIVNRHCSHQAEALIKMSVPIAQAVKEKRGVVHSFEPQRMMFYALCGTAALNDLENLFVHFNGAGADKGFLKIPRIDYGKPQDFGMVSLARQDGIDEYERVPIAVIDELELPRLDFL